MTPLDGGAVLAQSLPAPDIDYGMLMPMLVVFGAAVLGVLVEAFLPSRARYAAHLVLSFGGLILALVAVVVKRTRGLTAGGAVVIDGATLFLQASILVVSLLSIALIAERSVTTIPVAASA